MIAMWSSDDVTLILRWMLLVNAALAAVAVEQLYRKSDDINPIPWRATSALFALYAANVAALIFTAELVIDDWYRPVFSLLNIGVTIFPLWLLTRTVKLHRLKQAAVEELTTSTTFIVAPERRSGVDRRSQRGSRWQTTS